MMIRRYWMLAVPLLMLFGLGQGLSRPKPLPGADGRLVDARLLELEKELGYHLYAPTWLPHKGAPGILGTKLGAHRVLQDFCYPDGTMMVFVAQERRTPERDVYHAKHFIRTAEARAEINGKKGYLSSGKSGERRLFWHEPETSMIVSSPNLDDGDLVRIARKIQ